MLAEGVINTTRFENDELHWSFSPTCPACQSLNPLDTLIDIDRSYNFRTIVQLTGQVIMQPFGQTEIKSPRTQPDA